MTADPCELLAWDSEHFGIRIAQLRSETLDPGLADAADSWCAENEIACLSMLARPDDIGTIRLAGERGFRLVDVRIGYERELGTPEDDLPALPETAEIRPAVAGDLEAIRELAAVSNRTGRFHHDPNFDLVRCDELYRRWVERDLFESEWAMLVAEDADGIAGFFSGRLPDPGSERTRTSLAAVAERARGRRIAVGLFSAMLAGLRNAGARHVTAYANAGNAAALRLHPSAGFVVGSVGLWYHRWYLPAGG